MKQIPLTQGKVALVDDYHYEKVKQFKWCAVNQSGHFYAASRVRGKKTSLHHLVLRPTKELPCIVFKNGDGLDCRMKNLLRLPKKDAHIVRSGQKDCTSRFKGVRAYIFQNKYIAQITVNQKKITIGIFNSEEKAALAYNKAAIKYFGEFARLNKVV